MYKPARPRPRLTSITRTRSGCMTCRRRKKRCDEAVPQCSACSRLGLDCVPPSTSIKFSSQRSLVGPSPATSRESWRYETDSSAASPSSANHGSSSRAPVIPSPVTESSPPLLTPAVSYDHLTPEDTPSSLDTRRESLYSTSLSLHPQDDTTFHDWDYSDCTFLLEGDWGSDPWPFQLEVSTELEPTYDQSRDAPSHQARPARQPWFTALPAEQETMSNSENNDSGSQHSESSMLYELRKLYTNHWETSVLDILSPTFRELSSHIETCEALKSGILALSAAHLGHIHIQVRTKFGTDNEYYIGPNQVHLVYMRQFYDAALRHLSDTISNPSGDSVLILGSLLILMLVEKTVGSFRGEAFHESGIDKLASEEFRILSEDTLGRALLREWLILRAENWSHRIPFTVLSYGKALAEAGIDFVSFLSQDAVLPIMLESWYQNEMILFERFVGRGDMESISSRCYRFYHGLVKENQHTTLPWRPAEYPPDDDYRKHLDRLSSALDKWHSGLLLDDHPIEAFGPQQASKQSRFLTSSSDPRLFSLKPLHFRSHRAAMNYAYYLCARILQSSALISCWEQRSIGSDDSEDGSDWILLLLRLLLGLDPKICFEENIFTVGLSELILVGLQRLPPVIQPDQEQPLSSELFISFARTVVSTFESRSIFREGHCSLERFKDFVYLTDRLRRECGKSMFFLIAGEADTAWTKIYGHGMDTAIILGRDCHTQKLFGERVVIAPGKES